MAEWRSDIIRTNGINIHYHRTGSDKPALVLAHGITDNGLCFTRLARALEDDFDLILVDARGHGHSDKPKSGYGSMYHAADLAGLIEGLHLDRPGVIGHSMGAATAATLGANWPELARCLVLEDPPWRLLDTVSGIEPAARRYFAERIARRQQLSLEQVIAEGHKLNPKWHADDFPAWAQAKHQVGPQVLNIETQSVPWGEAIAKLQCPTLLVAGEPGTPDSDMEAIVTPEIAQRAHELNTLVEPVQVLGAAHNIRRDQFDGFWATVHPFLDRIYQ